MNFWKVVLPQLPIYKVRKFVELIDDCVFLHFEIKSLPTRKDINIHGKF